MFTASKLSIYRAITPLHCGGSEGGGVDLPVARERFTQFPIIPASSLKGVWRDLCQNKWQDSSHVEAAFGPAPDDLDEEDLKENSSLTKVRRYAGCLGFVDAQILFLPVRTSCDVFALLTCPLQVRRFFEAKTLAGLPTADFPEELAIEDDNTIVDLPGSGLFGEKEERVYLEDVELTLAPPPTGIDLSWLPELKKRLSARTALVSDETFKWFAVNAMEVVAHNKLNDKTKQSENLWYEEAVPAESIFFALLLTGPSHQPLKKDNDQQNSQVDYLEKITKTETPFFQVGGHETTGRGIVEITHL